MPDRNQLLSAETASFLKSLGFPEVTVHRAFDHFDFTRAGRRFLVIGPMGSGKTEFSAGVWRDSQVVLKKSDRLLRLTETSGADRRKVFFVRSLLDANRFPDYPPDALAYRGGFERCGERIVQIRDSFDLEKIIADHPEVGTWIIDEASFYDERIAYVITNESKRRGLLFIFPTLVLNFRKDIFNATARLLLEMSTDVFPLTAYCEHPDCIERSFYTYRYYLVDGKECPALYFDPLIIIGGDRQKDDPREPNYCTRCDRHHYLPGKEYTFLHLKPMGEAAGRGDSASLRKELTSIIHSPDESALFQHFNEKYTRDGSDPFNMNALKVPCIVERMIVYLYAEENMLSKQQVTELVRDLNLDVDYLERRLSDNRRAISFR